MKVKKEPAPTAINTSVSTTSPQKCSLAKLKEMVEVLTAALEMMEAELHLQNQTSKDLSSWLKALKEGERD